MIPNTILQLAHSSPRAVLFLTRRGEILTANRSACAFFGFAMRPPELLAFDDFVDASPHEVRDYLDTCSRCTHFATIEVTLLDHSNRKIRCTCEGRTINTQSESSVIFLRIRPLRQPPSQENVQEYNCPYENHLRCPISTNASSEKTTYIDILETIVDSIPVGVILVDAETQTVVRVNNHAVNMTGIEKNDLLGQRCSQVFCDSEHPLCPMFAGDTSEHRKEHTIRNIDGTDIPVLKHVVRVFVGGQPHMLEIFNDLTAIKKIEAERQSQYELLDTLLNTIPNAIFYKDPDGIYQGCNDTFAKWACKSREAIVGKTAFDLFPRQTAIECAESDQQLLANPGYKVYETRLEHRDGSFIDVLFNKAVYCDAEGNTAGIIGAVTDISERKQSEEQLAEHARTLEETNAALEQQRAEANAARIKAEKAKSELEDTQRQLIAISREAGIAEIATNVLHNVGNTLTSINTAATMVVRKIRDSRVSSLVQAVDLLNENSTDIGTFLTTDEKGKVLPQFLTQLTQHLVEEQKAVEKELHTLTESVTHAKGILSTQQTYARRGGVLQEFSVAQLIDITLEMHRESIQKNNITVTKDLDVVPNVTADRHKLIQILVNLITNAKDALLTQSADNRVLTITLRLDSEGRVTIDVTDNGVGIPSENKDRVFSHGFTTKQHGHGFGLHSSALAAKEMGGTLRASSDGEGKGATFILTFPVCPKGAAK